MDQHVAQRMELVLKEFKDLVLKGIWNGSKNALSVHAVICSCNYCVCCLFMQLFIHAVIKNIMKFAICMKVSGHNCKKFRL